MRWDEAALVSPRIPHQQGSIKLEMPDLNLPHLALSKELIVNIGHVQYITEIPLSGKHDGKSAYPQ
jgi:hypothetical protein